MTYPNTNSDSYRSLSTLMMECSSEVVSTCDAVVGRADPGSYSPRERRGLVDTVEQAVGADLQYWCTIAAPADHDSEAAFDRVTALVEVAEATMVCYLAQRYGLRSAIPLTWTPELMPVRWDGRLERKRAIEELIGQRTRLLRRDGRKPR